MADGATTNSDGGSVRYQGLLDVVLGTVDAGGGNVSVNAVAGSILDGGDNGLEVIGNGLRLSAGENLGESGVEMDALEIQVDRLSAGTGVAGINLIESDGLRVTQVAVEVNRVQVDGGTVTLADGQQGEVVSEGDGSIGGVEPGG